MPARISRRGFIKHSAAWGTLVASGCSSTLNALRQPAVMTTPRRGANDEIRVAIVGFNGRGGSHIQHHANGNNVRVVALCDVDERLFEKGIKIATTKGAPAPRADFDIRRVLDAKDVDCVSIATPNHSHALESIWACQAGKDVYVEKPCCHNIFEGRQLVEAARKYNRVVQHGTQSRSTEYIREAIKLLHEGVIGEVYMARALCFKGRDSIGIKEDCPVPEGVHYDPWLGPAPVRPFNPNRFHYNWHWNWDYGNGDIGNQGVHQMDIAVWGLNKDRTLPVKISSMGGRYTYQDQGVTPNTQVATFQYEDGKMFVFEVRGRQTHDEWGVRVGNLFYGSKGYLAIRNNGYEIVVDGKVTQSGKAERGDHFENFHNVVRSRNLADLTAPIEPGFYSSAHCHLANIAYRLGRTVQFNPKAEKFIGDREADAMLTRHYRAPYIVPRVV